MILGSIGEDLLRAILQGGPPGVVYGLIAVGLVLTYKTAGVFNVAFGAQAYAAAAVYHKLVTDLTWPILPSVVVAAGVVSPLLGYLLHVLVFRHIRTAPAVAKLVATIGLAIAIPGLVGLVIEFERVTPPSGIVPGGNSVFYEVFGLYSFSRNELMSMAVALGAVLGLATLFRWSMIGLRMRAAVESPRMTALNGVAPDRVAAFAWALSSFFAGLAGLLIAPRFSTLAPGEYFNLIVVGIAAAAVARLVDLPRALAGGIGLGVAIAAFSTFVPRWAETLTWLRPIQTNLTPALPFVALFCVIAFDPKVRRTREQLDPLSGVDPPASVETSSDRRTVSRGVRVARWAVAALAVAFVFAEADTVWLFRLTQATGLAIVFLSITVVTGFAGQISLCQGTLAAVGAFTTFQMVDRFGMSVLVAALFGSAMAGTVGAAVAFFLRRLTGIWVAIATLAFAYFFDAVMVKLTWVSGVATANPRVPRPVVGPWDFTDDQAFLVLAIVVLALVVLAVRRIRTGGTGLNLRAVRGSDVAAQASGISPSAVRVTAFAIGGSIAGLGGAVLSMHQESVNYASSYTPFGSLFWLVLVVTIGVRHIGGAIAAAAVFVLGDAVFLQGTFLGWLLRSQDRVPGLFPLPPEWLVIGFGFATLSFAKHPEGIVDQVRSRRAHRRRGARTVDGGLATEVAGA